MGVTDSLAGHLLVATTSMNDPNFDRTVVFLIEHGPEGAVGVVLNRPLDVAVADALPDDAVPPVLDELSVVLEEQLDDLVAFMEALTSPEFEDLVEE